MTNSVGFCALVGTGLVPQVWAITNPGLARHSNELHDLQLWPWILYGPVHMAPNHWLGDKCAGPLPCSQAIPLLSQTPTWQQQLVWTHLGKTQQRVSESFQIALTHGIFHDISWIVTRQAMFIALLIWNPQPQKGRCGEPWHLADSWNHGFSEEFVPWL